MGNAKAIRGVDKFYVSKLLTDTAAGITYDTPRNLAAIQHVAREEGEESAKVYADNKVQIVVKGKGASTATFTTLVLDPVDEAYLLGKKTIGSALVSSEKVEDVYFGVMYRLKNTDGSFTYVSIQKAKFLTPSEDVETQNEGTDVSLMEITCELSTPVYEYTIGGDVDSVDYIKYLQGAGDADISSTFFAEMQTPETIGEIGGTCAAPVVLPAASGILTTDTVSITSATANSRLYYTVDGSDPSATAGTLYSAPFTLEVGAIAVKAIAVKDNFADSAVTSKTYEVTQA